MSDTLPTLSTETLTVAVTSLLQRPLPDGDHMPNQSSKDGSRKTKQSGDQQSALSRTKKVRSSKQSGATEAKQSRASGKANGTKSKQKRRNNVSYSKMSTNVSIWPSQTENTSENRKSSVTVPSVQIIPYSAICSSEDNSGKESNNQKSSSKGTLTKVNKISSEQNGLGQDKRPVSMSTTSSVTENIIQKQCQSGGSALRDLLTRAKLNDQSKLTNEQQHGLWTKTDQTVKCAPKTIQKLARSLSETSSGFAKNGLMGTNSTVKPPLSNTVLVTSSSKLAETSLIQSTSVSSITAPVSVLSFNQSGLVSTASLQGSRYAVQVTVKNSGPSTDQHSGIQSFSFTTPWVPHHLTDGKVPMLSLGPGINIPLTIRPANTQLTSALLSRFPAILPKSVPNKSTTFQTQHAPKSEVHESSCRQTVSLATPVHSIPETHEKQHISTIPQSLLKLELIQHKPASTETNLNAKIGLQQGHLISMATSGHSTIHLPPQPFPIAAAGERSADPKENSSVTPAKHSVLQNLLQSVSIETPANLTHGFDLQQLPVSMATPTAQTGNNLHYQPGSLTTSAMTVQSSQPFILTSHTVNSAQDVYEQTSVVPSQASDPTGMEIQSLMNIVYGHLLEKERLGTTPTPSSLMLESAYRHFTASGQTGNSPPITSQSEVGVQGQPQTQSGLTPHYSNHESMVSESQSYESHHGHSANQDPESCDSYQSNHPGRGDGYQSNLPEKDVGYQSNQPPEHDDSRIVQSEPSHIEAGMVRLAADHESRMVDQGGTDHIESGMVQQAMGHESRMIHQNGPNNIESELVHQAGLGRHQLHAAAHFVQSNTAPGMMPNQSYPVVNQQHPAEYFHQTVISHTDQLQQSVPMQGYQYDGSATGPSACLYRENFTGQMNEQNGIRSYHQVNNAVATMDSFKANESLAPVQYNELQSNNILKNVVEKNVEEGTETHLGTEKKQDVPEESTEDRDVEMYCFQCNRQLKNPCHHLHNNAYIHIEDSPVLTIARASVPGCLYLKKTETVAFNSLGVWCSEDINFGISFGPVIGPSRTELRGEADKENLEFNPYKVFERDKATCYNMVDETLCNWMMFIRLAASLGSQNCVLFQQGKKLYVVTNKTIRKDTELLMWFSSDLCLRLKVSQDPSVCKLEQCLTCGLQFLSKKLLRSHRKMKHPSEVTDSFACYLCGKSYSSRTKLNSHTLIHMGVKPHRCLYCNKEFTDYSNLKVHQYIHTGQKKYQCSKCSRTFRQKSHLNSHMVTHTGEKNYKCRYCEKVFARQSDCKTHEYNHTQEKMYTCEVCRKVFYKLQSYKRHQKVHTGERNYMCNKCFKGFHTKYHRDRHLKICKEKSEKESTYMSLEEVANLDNTCDAVPLTVKAHEVAAENQSEDGHHFQNNIFTA